MNKYIQELITELQFESEGKVHFGTVEGYQGFMVIDPFAAAAFQGGFFVYLKDRAPEIRSYISDHKKEMKILNFTVGNDGIAFNVMVMTNKSGASNMKTAIHAIAAYLRSLGIDGEVCPLCGKPMEEKKRIALSGIPVFVDGDCAREIETEVRKTEEEYQSSPDNYLKGTLGAFVGGLIGGVAWVIIGLLGFVSGWIAFLIAFLAGVGYDKMKGNPNSMKLVITSLTTVVVIVISMFAMYFLLVRLEMNESGITGSAVTLFFEMLSENKELQSEFLLNMILALLFGAFGITFSIVRMRKQIHR